MSDLRKVSTSSDRRAYGRLRSGLLYHRGKESRFVTLTYARIQDPKSAKREFSEFLRVLRRDYHLEYFMAHTLEGNGSVHHICLVGDRMPTIREIRTRWTTQTGATQLDVKRLYSMRGFFLEMTRQQKVSRYSQSRGWLWKASWKDWKHLVRAHIHFTRHPVTQEIQVDMNMKTVIRRWQEMIMRKRNEREESVPDISTG